MRSETTSPAVRGQGYALPAGSARFDERTILFGASPNDIKVSGQDTEGRLGVFEYVGAGPGGPPLHLHEAQDEVYFVQDGEYLFQVGEQRSVVKAGGMIFLPRGVSHAFAQLSQTGRMLFMFSPAGDMEDYFRRLAGLDGSPSPQQAAALFADHGMRLVGPPLDPSHVAG
jgi:mannose-6-phosphate isomerase-like protein (cupin superfamily)